MGNFEVQKPIFNFAADRIRTLAYTVRYLKELTDNGKDEKAGKQFIEQLPVTYMELLMTGKCNIHCPACKERSKSDVQFELLEPLINDASRLSQLCNRSMHVRLTGGEPSLHPDLLPLVSLCKKNPNSTINLSSNGVMSSQKARQISEAGLDSIGISLQEIRYTGESAKGLTAKQHEQVLETISILVDSPTQVYLNQIITIGNIDDLIKTFQWAIKHGLTDIQLMSLKGGFSGDGISPTEDQIRRFKEQTEPTLVSMISNLQITEPGRFNNALSNHKNGGIYFIDSKSNTNDHLNTACPCYITLEELMLAFDSNGYSGGLPWRCSYIFRDSRRNKNNVKPLTEKPVRSLADYRLSPQFWEQVARPILSGMVSKSDGMCSTSCSPLNQRVNRIVHQLVQK